MRDRQKTIEALRRLSEHPGTDAEGDTARRLLEQMGGGVWTPIPFPGFPRGTRIYYCYWCYRNTPGVTVSAPEWRRGQQWMRIRFDHLKQPRWVPVTSELGCHIAETPFSGHVEETLYRGDIDWALKDDEFRRKLRELVIVPPDLLEAQARALTATGETEDGADTPQAGRLD